MVSFVVCQEFADTDKIAGSYIEYRFNDYLSVELD
jgi:hypothetical protein